MKAKLTHKLAVLALELEFQDKSLDTIEVELIGCNYTVVMEVIVTPCLKSNFSSYKRALNDYVQKILVDIESK